MGGCTTNSYLHNSNDDGGWCNLSILNMKDILGREIQIDRNGREYIIYGHDNDGYLFREKTAEDKVLEFLYESDLKKGLLTEDEAQRLEREAEISAKIDIMLEPNEKEKAEFHDWMECEKAKSHLSNCTKCGDEIRSDEDSLCGNCI